MPRISVVVVVVVLVMVGMELLSGGGVVLEVMLELEELGRGSTPHSSRLWPFLQHQTFPPKVFHAQ